MKKLLYFAFVLIAGACFTVSCSEDDSDVDSRNGNGQNEYTIYLDQDVLEAKHMAGAYDVRVRSNGNWTAEIIDAKVDWATITDGSGVKDEEGKFSVSLTANTGEELRTAVIRIKAGTATTNLTIVQRPKSGSWMVFDKAAGGKYFADYSKNAGLLVLSLSGGNIDNAGHMTGKAYTLNLNCYAPFADDPNRGGITGGLYEYTNDTQTVNEFTLIGSSDYAKSGIMIYDENGTKKLFAAAEGSTLSSVRNGNRYELSGQFVDEEGNTIDWYYNGIIEFKNEMNILEDIDGNIILRADDIYESAYMGDVDQGGSGKIFFDVRDRSARKGIRLWIYTELPYQHEPGTEEPPYDGMLQMGTYNVTPGYGVQTISPGYVEDDGQVANAFPSFAYYVDGAVNLERLISEGAMEVKRYNTEEYDILFNLKGTDSQGKLGDIQKYRFIGKISLVDKKPTYVNFNPAFCEFHYGGPADGLTNTGKYRFIMAIDTDTHARLTQRVSGEFYGPLPSDESVNNNKITLPEGTYTKTDVNTSAVSGNFLNSYGSNYNPRGTFFWSTDELKTAYMSGAYGGTFTITHEAVGGGNTNTTIDINIKCHDAQRGNTAVVKMSYKAYYQYCIQKTWTVNN